MLKLSSQKPTQSKSDLLAIPVCEDHNFFEDQIVMRLSQKAAQMVEFSGKKDERLIFYEATGFQTKRILFIGMGKLDKLNSEILRQVAGIAVKKALRKKLSTVDLFFPLDRLTPIEKKMQVQAILEGAGLANHIDEKYKTEPKKKPLKTIRLLISSQDTKEYTTLADQISIISNATHLAREWVNMPPNEKPPLTFANMITKLARKVDLKASLIKEKELIEKKFGAMLAVASGSNHRPCLLILEYRSSQAQKRVALVGKGITFDSGGINLKSSLHMGDMKADMSGAAAVAATLLAAAQLKPNINIIGILPLAENLPSGHAYRPGDIVRAYGGKTIEIGNTDAEGRLILADAMAFAVDSFNPHIMIDLATLTGACVVALGSKIAGVFSLDDSLADAIIEAGEYTHERCWRMPMPEDYKKLIKSDIADIRNVGHNRWGGAIAAALFLSEFVAKTRFAHIDIAGPAYGKKDNSYTPSGASGFGVRLLCNLLQRIETI
jgi:leucyl aminopeptidase